MRTTPSALDAVDLTISTTTYRYEPWRTANAEWGMWIAEGVTLEEAIEALFSAYRKEAKR
jgi:hypothetical protein